MRKIIILFTMLFRIMAHGQIIPAGNTNLREWPTYINSSALSTNHTGDVTINGSLDVAGNVAVDGSITTTSISVDSNIVANIELAETCGIIPDIGVIGKHNGAMVLGDGTTQNGEPLAYHYAAAGRVPLGYHQFVAAVVDRSLSSEDKAVLVSEGGDATGWCYQIDGGTNTFCTTNTIALPEDGSVRTYTIWPATNETSGVVGYLNYIAVNKGIGVSSYVGRPLDDFFKASIRRHDSLAELYLEQGGLSLGDDAFTNNVIAAIDYPITALLEVFFENMDKLTFASLSDSVLGSLSYINCDNLISLNLDNVDIGDFGYLRASDCPKLSEIRLTNSEMLVGTTEAEVYIVNCNLSEGAINTFLTDLPANTNGAYAVVQITGCPGSATADKTIATSKGWYTW
jgi:hypothetical protein